MPLVPPIGFEGARRLVGEATGFGLLVESAGSGVYYEFGAMDPQAAAELRELRLRDGGVDELVALARRRDRV